MRRLWLTLALLAMTPMPVAAKDTSSAEASNKALVLRMWHDVIDRRNIAHAPRYIARDYVQHSPGIGQGRDAVMAFLRKEFAGFPAPKPGDPLTRFAFVIAQGDLVQLMFKRRMPSLHDPAKLVDVWWYDTYRVRNGMIVEHWDSARS